MSTVVQICNSALSLLGVDEPIQSLSDNSKSARLCNINYPVVRDALLEEHYWKFALKRAELARINAEPLFDFRYQYQLPNDLIRIKDIDGDSYDTFKKEGNRILTNLTVVRLLYVAQVTDTSLYSASFKEALAFRLAAKLAYALVQSSTHMERLINEAREMVRVAKSTDGQSDTLDSLIDDSFVESRTRGRGYPGIDTDV